MSTKAAGWMGLACAIAWASACGQDPVDVDPAVAPFVGTWDAVVFLVTNDAPPNVTVDVLASFGPFWISIEPSGRYQATFEFIGGGTDFGQLTVANSSTLTLDGDSDAPAPSAYVLATADSLVLDGATDFDFNLDGTSEPAQAHIELLRSP